MKHLLLCAALIAVLLYACSNGSGSAQAEQKVPAATQQPSTAGANAKKAGGASLNADVTMADVNGASADSTAVANNDAIKPQSGTPVANSDWDKKIIKTANLTLELNDYKTYNGNIHARVRAFGAYIAQEQQSETDGQIMNDIVIKVPVDKFDDVINSLGGDGVKVIQKNISSEDVTGEVIDTRARLEAKKQVRDRYLDLLKQAKTMKDILDVQEQVNTIQEDIESAAGRVNYLVHSAAYSTVNIKYYQFLNGVTAKDIEPTFITKIAEAFKTGGEIITNIILFFISIWPLCVGGILLVFYFRKWRGKKLKPVIIE